MDKGLSFDFCIIPNPFSSGKRNMIFVTKSGDDFLNREIVDSKDYKDVKEIIEQFGYTETNHLQFESSNNISPELSIKEIEEFLEDCGLSYSRDLEVNIIKDLDKIKEETTKLSSFELIYSTTDELDYDSIKKETKNKLIESKSELFEHKHELPEPREKVTLYFYLFLEFGFNQFGKPIIQFGGDFQDSEDYDDRNYIKIVKSEFERVKDPKKPSAVVLSSVKKQSDFLKEAGILYSGYFKYSRNIEKGDNMMVQERKYPYKLAEVKKFLDPNQAIVVETNRMGYDNLIALSNKIEAESIAEEKQKIDVDVIQVKAEELKDFLQGRMEKMSQEEDFEEAMKIKQDVDFIEEQMSYVKGLDKPEITTKEYFDIFSIS